MSRDQSSQIVEMSKQRRINSKFHSLETICDVSDIKLQIVENLNETLLYQLTIVDTQFKFIAIYQMCVLQVLTSLLCHLPWLYNDFIVPTDVLNINLQLIYEILY